MTDRDALYRAILAHPDDDTPRLVYADWLEEHDRGEEAEFIRVGCRLDAVPPDHPDYPELLARHEELVLRLGACAPGPTPAFAGGLQVDGGPLWWRNSRRGFPRFLEFEPRDRTGTKVIRSMAAGLEKAFAALPTRWLVVRHVTTAQFAELLKQPVVERLDAITVQFALGNEPHDEAARLIAHCPRLRNVRRVCAAFHVGEVGADALARSGHLGRVEGLTVPGGALTPAAVRALAAADWFRGLRALAVNSYFPNEAFDELCRSGPFPRLHTLDLSENSLTSWEAFARSKAFPALARLELRGNPLAPLVAWPLFEAAWLRPAYLDLRLCVLGNGGAEELARAPWLGGVRWLNLNWNLLTARGAAALAASPHLAALRHLDLGNNTLGAGGLRALAKNPALRGLLELGLRADEYDNRGLASEHVRDFLSRLDMPNLRHLSLAEQPVGGRAARLLADPKFSSLTRLDLSGCKLTDPAAAALLAAPSLQNLIELNLSSNGLKTAPEALADRRTLPRLAACQLHGNRLGDAARRKLARRAGVVV